MLMNTVDENDNTIFLEQIHISLLSVVLAVWLLNIHLWIHHLMKSQKGKANKA